MSVSKATGKPRIRSADSLLDETRLVHQSRDNALQWIIDNMATKDDLADTNKAIADLTQAVKDGFNALGINIANGDHRIGGTAIRPVK